MRKTSQTVVKILVVLVVIAFFGWVIYGNTYVIPAQASRKATAIAESIRYKTGGGEVYDNPRCVYLEPVKVDGYYDRYSGFGFFVYVSVDSKELTLWVSGGFSKLPPLDGKGYYVIDWVIDWPGGRIPLQADGPFDKCPPIKNP